MSELELEKKLHEIREIGEKYAKAKGNRVELEYSRHIVKADLMKEAMLRSTDFKSAAAQEREAYASPRYKEHIKSLAYAIEEEEGLEWQKKIIQFKFEMWKTTTIHQIVEKKNYG